MNHKIRGLVIIGVILLVIFLVAVTLAVAQNISNQGVRGNRNPGTTGGRADPQAVRQSPPKVEKLQSTNATTILQMAGSALRPESSIAVEWLVDGEYPGCIFVDGGSEFAYWNAPIYPPQGATLTKMRVYYYDESTNEMTVNLGVVDSYGDDLMAWTANSSGSTGWGYVDMIISNHVVDYSQYSYLIWWIPNAAGNHMELCGLQLYYTPPISVQFLPAIQNQR